jgi:hypothetical protein
VYSRCIRSIEVAKNQRAFLNVVKTAALLVATTAHDAITGYDHLNTNSTMLKKATAQKAALTCTLCSTYNSKLPTITTLAPHSHHFRQVHTFNVQVAMLSHMTPRNWRVPVANDCQNTPRRTAASAVDQGHPMAKRRIYIAQHTLRAIHLTKCECHHRNNGVWHPLNHATIMCRCQRHAILPPGVSFLAQAHLCCCPAQPANMMVCCRCHHQKSIVKTKMQA